MKKLAKNGLSVIGLSVALVFSGNALADDDDKKKHYGNHYFNGHYDDRYDDDDRDERYDYRRGRYANYHDRYTRVKRARVIDVDPVYRSVRGEPRAHQECWTEPRRRVSRSDRRAGSVAGAIIGGVIGYKMGGNHRHNKRSGAAVGAVLGSVIGSEAAKNKHYDRRHCETVYSGRSYARQELIGYDVTYKYKGERYKTFTDYHPGRYIDIRITAEPILR